MEINEQELEATPRDLAADTAIAQTDPAEAFDERLKERDFQSEFDRRVSRALETARAKWTQETQQRIEEARAESERLARMSGEERIQHDYQQRLSALETREREITERELRAQAGTELAARGLPQELSGALNYADAEALANSMNATEAAFRAAVQAGVVARMRGDAPQAAAHHAAELSDEDYYRARNAMGAGKN